MIPILKSHLFLPRKEEVIDKEQQWERGLHTRIHYWLFLDIVSVWAHASDSRISQYILGESHCLVDPTKLQQDSLGNQHLTHELVI